MLVVSMETFGNFSAAQGHSLNLRLPAHESRSTHTTYSTENLQIYHNWRFCQISMVDDHTLNSLPAYESQSTRSVQLRDLQIHCKFAKVVCSGTHIYEPGNAGFLEN